MTYNEFIQNILSTRGRFNVNGYKERHHILPKCMGGNDDKENLIDLTAQEHYEAHRLLAIENPDNNSLQLAWYNFHIRKASPNTPKIEVAADDYAAARIAHSKAISAIFKGRDLYWLHTKEVIDKMITSRKGKCLSGDNPAACPVICIETKQIFETFRDAANFYNICNNISRACDTGCKCGGFHWKRMNEYIEDIIYQSLNIKVDFDKDWYRLQSKGTL